MDPSQDNTQPNQGLDLSAVRSKNLPHEEKTGGPGQSAGGPADPNAVPVPALAFDVDEASFNDVVAISDRVPVVIDLQAEWSEQGKQLSPIVERIVESFGGRLVLARVDVDANPRLQQAFGVESIPNVIAIVKGQPVPLFQSALPEAQVKAYFDELLKLAGENGVTGHAVVAGAEQEPAGPAHPEAEEALNRGDFDTAESLFKSALAASPADEEAKFGLARAGLGRRLIDADPQQLIATADANPKDPEAAKAAADAEIVGGNPSSAFNRLISLIRVSAGDEKEALRLRVLELFEVLGADDPAVTKARTALMRALF
ncbi:MAG: tetratricopeptide repeat protein [Brevibacterium aurantiacum]|nr:MULTISPECIES: tetratricopeptide repeat protein [Brevibacterium]MDN5549334.1 tetratricopeptide repeat protein [Brevibacterium sp.]MDN5711460.1 tetratricopeptide repeat protein [Brevibacterium aurantiacum]MDN5735137.1 tetratricopeptide repeat protein [Brevibacterium aurantiacum]MDN5737230.1 tetratricopeptide repeat protein [Brevibacterium aurantiacum]MDN5772698.1 tetratricopeptide repeat protein [Brevibacterium aurantiacum]